MTKDPETTKRLDHRRRIGLVIFTALISTCFGGAFFGWGNMMLLLESNGAFSSRCDEMNEHPCPAQTTRLLLVQFIAQLSFIFSPLLGAMADRFGAIMVMGFSTFCGCLGLTFLLLATADHIDLLLFPAFLLLGFMAMSCVILVVQCGQYFGSVTRQRVISALNTLSDAGTFTYLILWSLKKITGAKVAMIVGGYLAAAILFFGGGIYFWHVAVPVNEEQKTETNDITEADDRDTDRILPSENGTSYGSTTVACEESELQRDRSGTIKGMAAFEMDPENQASDSDSQIQFKEKENCTATNGYVLIAERSPLQQLRSKQYVSLSLFFAIHATQDVFTVTTGRDFLSHLGDDETGNTYLAIFTLLAPVSILGLPFLDWILNRYGYYAMLQLINILALGHGIIMVSSESLNVQVLGFLIASFFRCFLYSTTFSFVPTFLGAQVVGKGSGILPCVTGIFGFVNIPLAHWAINGLDGNFFYPNIFFTLLVLPCIGLAWIMGKGILQEMQATTNTRSRAGRN